MFGGIKEAESLNLLESLWWVHGFVLFFLDVELEKNLIASIVSVSIYF